MIKHVVSAKYIDGYKVWLAFDDGMKGEVDLMEKIANKKGVFEPLKNIDNFKKFKIINDTLSWDNGADLAPESLYEILKKQSSK